MDKAIIFKEIRKTDYLDNKLDLGLRDRSRIFINKLASKLFSSTKNPKIGFKDDEGNVWIYNTLSELSKEMKLSVSTVSRIIEGLVNEGIIQKEKMSKSELDHTMYYSFTIDFLSKVWRYLTKGKNEEIVNSDTVPTVDFATNEHVKMTSPNTSKCEYDIEQSSSLQSILTTNKSNNKSNSKSIYIKNEKNEKSLKESDLSLAESKSDNAIVGTNASSLTLVGEKAREIEGCETALAVKMHYNVSTISEEEKKEGWQNDGDELGKPRNNQALELLGIINKRLRKDYKLSKQIARMLNGAFKYIWKSIAGLESYLKAIISSDYLISKKFNLTLSWLLKFPTMYKIKNGEYGCEAYSESTPLAENPLLNTTESKETPPQKLRPFCSEAIRQSVEGARVETPAIIATTQETPEIKIDEISQEDIDYIDDIVAQVKKTGKYAKKKETQPAPTKAPEAPEVKAVDEADKCTNACNVAEANNTKTITPVAVENNCGYVYDKATDSYRFLNSEPKKKSDKNSFRGNDYCLNFNELDESSKDPDTEYMTKEDLSKVLGVFRSKRLKW